MAAMDPLGAHRSTPAELQARLEAERGDSPFVVLRDGAGRQRIETLQAGRELSIGRDPQADICVDWDSDVSRLHATLLPIGGVWAVVDDGLSRNGTFVGSERVRGRRRLADRDMVRVGDTQLVFRDPRRVDAAEATRADESSFDLELSKMQRAVLVALRRPLEAGTAPTPATNQEIADELCLSVAAVKTHLRTLFAKFGLADLEQNRKRAALAEAALKAPDLF